MVPKVKLDSTTNPIDLLDHTLEQSWNALCAAYEVDAEMPEVQSIFEGAAIKTLPKRRKPCW